MRTRDLLDRIVSVLGGTPNDERLRQSIQRRRQAFVAVAAEDRGFDIHSKDFQQRFPDLHAYIQVPPEEKAGLPGREYDLLLKRPVMEELR